MDEEIDALEYFRNNSHKAPERINAELYGLASEGKIFHPTWEQAKVTYEKYYKDNNQKYDEASLKKLYNMSLDNYKRYSKNEFNADQSILVNPYSVQAERAGWPQIFTKTQSTNNERELLKDTGFDLSFDLDANNNGMSLYHTIAASRLDNTSKNSKYQKLEDSWEQAKENFQKNGLLYEKDETTGEIKLDQLGKPVVKRVDPEEYDFSFIGLFGKAGKTSWELHFDPDGKPVVVPVDGNNDLYKNADVKSIWSVSSMESDGGSLPVTISRIFPNVLANIVDTTAFVGDIIKGETVDNQKDDPNSWTKSAKIFANNLRANKNLDQNGSALDSTTGMITAIGQGVESMIPIIGLSALGSPMAGLGYAGLEAARGGYSEARNSGFTERESSMFATVMGTAAALSGKALEGAWLNKLAMKYGKGFAEKMGFAGLSKNILDKAKVAMGKAATMETREEILKSVIKQELPALTKSIMERAKNVWDTVKKAREENWILGTALNNEGLEELAEYVTEVPTKKFFREELFSNDLYKDLGWEPVAREKRYVDSMLNKSNSFGERSWGEIIKEGAEVFTVGQLTGAATMGYFNYVNRNDFKDKVQDGLIYESVLKSKDVEIEKESQQQLELIKQGKSKLGNNRLDVNGEVIDTTKDKWWEKTEAFTLWKLTDDKIKALQRTRDSLKTQGFGNEKIRAMYNVPNNELQEHAFKIYNDIYNKQREIENDYKDERDYSKTIADQFGITDDTNVFNKSKEQLLKDIFGEENINLPSRDDNFISLAEKVGTKNKEYYKVASELADLKYYRSTIDLSNVDKLNQLDSRIKTLEQQQNKLTNLTPQDKQAVDKILEIELLRKKLADTLNGSTVKKTIQEMFFKDKHFSKGKLDRIKKALEETTAKLLTVTDEKEINELKARQQNLIVNQKAYEYLQDSEFLTSGNISLKIEQFFNDNRVRKQDMILSKEQVDALEKQFKEEGDDLKQRVEASQMEIQNLVDTLVAYQNSFDAAFDKKITDLGLDLKEIRDLIIDDEAPVPDEYQQFIQEYNAGKEAKLKSSEYLKLGELLRDYIQNLVIDPQYRAFTDKSIANIFDKVIKSKVFDYDENEKYKKHILTINTIDFDKAKFNKKLADLTTVSLISKGKDLQQENHFILMPDMTHSEIADMLISTNGTNDIDTRLNKVIDSYLQTIKDKEDHLTQTIALEKFTEMENQLKDNLFRMIMNRNLMNELSKVVESKDKQDIYEINDKSYAYSLHKFINTLKTVENINKFSKDLSFNRNKKDNAISVKKIGKIFNLYKSLVDDKNVELNTKFKELLGKDYDSFKSKIDNITLPTLSDDLATDELEKEFKILTELEAELLKLVNSEQLMKFVDSTFSNRDFTLKKWLYNDYPKDGVGYFYSLDSLRDNKIYAGFYDYINNGGSEFTSSVEQLLVVREILGGLLNKHTISDLGKALNAEGVSFIRGFAGTGKTAMVVNTIIKIKQLLDPDQKIVTYTYNEKQTESLLKGIEGTKTHKNYSESSGDNMEQLLKLYQDAVADKNKIDDLPTLIIIDEVTIAPADIENKNDKINQLVIAVNKINKIKGKSLIKLVALGDNTQLIAKVPKDSPSKYAGQRIINAGLFATYETSGAINGENDIDSINILYTDSMEQVFRTGYQVHSTLDTSLVEQVLAHRLSKSFQQSLKLPEGMEWSMETGLMEGVKYSKQQSDLIEEFLKFKDQNPMLIVDSEKTLNELRNDPRLKDYIRDESETPEEKLKKGPIDQTMSIVTTDYAQGSQVDNVFVLLKSDNLMQNNKLDNDLVKRIARTAISRRKRYVNIYYDKNILIDSKESTKSLAQYPKEESTKIANRNAEKAKLFEFFKVNNITEKDAKKEADEFTKSTSAQSYADLASRADNIAGTVNKIETEEKLSFCE